MINREHSSSLVLMLSGLALLTYFVADFKKKTRVGNYEKKSKKSIEKKFRFSHVTFYNWSSNGGKLGLSVNLGMYGILNSTRTLKITTIESLSNLFDTVEVDELPDRKFYTLKKSKINFGSIEMENLLKEFDCIMVKEDE